MFHIVADSCCDLPTHLTEGYQNFSIVYLSYMIDGEPAKSDLTSPEFYDKLRKGGFSKTSQANPEAFVEEYQRVIASGTNEILYIGFSSLSCLTRNMVI